MNHCIAKIVDLIEQGRDDRRSVLQLGYNLGRLSELTGLGRELFWDRWKDAVADWDRPRLRQLAQELLKFSDCTIDRTETQPGKASPEADRE
jgi:hypothetical protein